MGFEPRSVVLRRIVVGYTYSHSNNLIGESYIEQVQLKKKNKTKIHKIRPKNTEYFVITLLPVEEQTE